MYKWSLVLALLATACSGESAGELKLVSQDPWHWALTSGGQALAAIPVEHVDLDRVELAVSGDAIALVQHHGRQGGATLYWLAGDTLTPLHRVSQPDGITSPLWRPDGRAVLFVRELPVVRSATGKLRHRGELWQVTLAGVARRLAATDEVARLVGWDRHGDLLFTLFASGDLGTAEHLARLPRGAFRHQLVLRCHGPIQCRQFTLSRADPRQVLFVRSEQPVVTAPGPHQELELRTLEPSTGRQRVLARERGAMPVALSTSDDGRITYRLEGRPLGRELDPRSGRVTDVPLRRRRPPLPPLPSESLYSVLTMPYVHQVYDTPNDFNGNWACGPTSTLQAILHFNKLDPWPHTVKVPTSHTSDYGAYVAYKYTAFGNTFDRKQNDPNGNPAMGGYGWCTENGAAWAWRMQDYAKKHDLKSDFYSSPSMSAIQGHLSDGKVVVLSTQLTSAGHIITVKGTKDGKLVVNDPYGDRNKPSYPNYSGEGAVYTWTQVKSKWYITVHGQISAPPAEVAAELTNSSGPDTMPSGSTAQASFTLRNKGSATWNPDNTRLGTTDPRDRTSPFETAASWVAPNRPTAVDADTATGQEGTFSFTLTAPTVCEQKSFVEHFNLVRSGTWASDDGQGGPDDKTLTLTIDVTPVDADGDGAADCPEQDCDDNDPDVHPGAAELCNGKDDNCDGQIDEGCAHQTDAGMVPWPDWGGQAAAVPLRGGCQLTPCGAAPSLPLWLLPLLLPLLWRRRRQP